MLVGMWLRCSALPTTIRNFDGLLTLFGGKWAWMPFSNLHVIHISTVAVRAMLFERLQSLFFMVG